MKLIVRHKRFATKMKRMYADIAAAWRKLATFVEDPNRTS